MAMAHYYSCEQAATASVDEAVDALRTDLDRGLEPQEVERRRASHGLNQVGVDEPDPLWKKYLEQFNNPFIMMLLVSAIISVLMKQFDDAVSITIAIVIVVTVGFVQEYRSEQTVERMKALLPPVCRCLRDGVCENIYAKYLVPGDVVRLSIGDKIPADVRLVEVNDLAVDESSFTGETEPKYKNTERAPESGLGRKMEVNDMTNIGFQGTLVINGNGVGVVVCTGERSQFGEVFKMMQSEDPPRAPLQKSMDTLGKQLSIYSGVVILIIMAIGCLQGKPWLEMFNVGVSLAVAAIPEGLPIVVTVTLAFGVMRMAKRNAVVKRLPTVEALGCVDFICSDKTGTLTTNEMSVSNLVTASEIASTSGPVLTDGEFSSDAETVSLLEIGALCNNATIGRHSEIQGTPTEKALLATASKLDVASVRDRHDRLQEIPFSGETKMMAVKCRRKVDGAESFFVKGATERVVNACKRFDYNGSSQAVSKKFLEHLEETEKTLALQGRRVLGFARGPAMDDLEFCGIVALLDPPRPGARESICTLRNSKVKVCMITGDGRETALSISSMLGLYDECLAMISGADIDAMTDPQLEKAAESCFCFYRTTPKHKVRIVKALQARGHIVGMTGDGVNDGVAIKKADVGVSMGVTGTDVCKEAADMILLDDDFSTILSAIEEGKCIFYNIRNFVRFQLSTSIAALMLISLSTLFNIPNPLNPMQILWINVIMDGPPAQSLGLEPVDPNVLKRPPRKHSEQILSRSLLANVLLSAFIIICGTLWVFREMMVDGQMTARDTTMTFTCFVFFDMFNALSSRSQERLIYEVGFFSNRMFVVAVALSIVGQLAVIYFPPLQYVFQTESLSFGDLVLLTALSSTVFIVCETKKLLSRYTLREILNYATGKARSPGRARANKGREYSPYAV